MFSAGTKVYVCCSSVTGKKLGPKRHSLGYISGGNTAYFINYNKAFPIKNQAFIIFPIKIVFTKYGKEEKKRCEAREFLHILPVFVSPPEKVNVGKIEEVIRVLQGDELSKNSVWYDIGCNYNNDPSSIGTVIPVGSAGTAQLEGNEARAWITSLLRHDTFRHLIIHNKNLPTLKNIVNNDILIWLSNAVKGSNARRDLLRWAEDDSDHMRSLIRALRMLTIIFDKRGHDQSLTVFDKLKGNPDMQSYLSWLTKGLFEEKSTLLKKVEIAKKISLDSSLANITKSIHLVRSTYLSLKPKYV